ncbi:hypothetical protein HDF18_13085 [Mucilaginibacter sp. X5P1]|uniref:hypothetical protein n=1 Tax=Mucilaginibacter sp. X5P1 TaxID=2723088 RepID=UPI0016207298|nr:hypothetical protein [Mucilaginibacter sp. X5P1]MBB6141727.1 hypothetical protein [Mucilaginibacter sp. X5P1]
MKGKKFIVDLSTIELNEKQSQEIQNGIEKLVSKVLIENAGSNNFTVSPITKQLAKESFDDPITIILGLIFK